jgi:uncharacterized membrane protein
VVEVRASPERAFAIWSRPEDFPRFLSGVSEVRKTGERVYHWVAEGPLGRRIEWDAKVTHSLPDRLIAWKSITDGVNNNGEIRFEPTQHGTRIFVTLRYGQLAGPIGALVARLTGSDPHEAVRQDLGRFKQLIEAGSSSAAKTAARR